MPVPLVVDVREVPRDRAALARVLLATVERTANRVLCNSRFTASLVTSLSPGLADRVRTVSNGVTAPAAVTADTWHGYGDDASRFYEGMDVAVVHSVLPEEFSLVTAEAQAAALPVVATGPGGPSDIVIDGAGSCPLRIRPRSLRH